MGLKIRFFLIFLFFLNQSFAQRPDSLIFKPQKIDSLKKIVADSAKKIIDSNKVTFNKFLKVVFTNQPSPKKRPALKPTYRSMVLPGWGQITNKEYWILPIIYGGAGVGVYFLRDNHQNYLLFRNALKTVLIKKEPATIIYNGTERTFLATEADKIEPAVNYYRRLRDLTIIGFGVGWALQAVQANVSAHLKSFDMSEDISLKIQPHFQSNFGSANVGVKVVVDF